MADESDVRDALAGIITSIVYPAGTSQPSIVGKTVRIYGGWPQANTLDADLLENVLHISVFPRANMVRNTTRWQQIERSQPPVAPTITATISGATVTFAGTITAGNIVGLQIGRTGYGYQIQATDTLASVAAYYATLFGGTSSGAAVTIPTNKPIAFSAVALGTATRETRRTEQGFTVTFWCPDPGSRDVLSKAVDTTLSDMPFITVGIEAVRLRFQTTTTVDTGENANLYRRDIIYHAEYGTQIVTTPPRALFVGGDITRVILTQRDLANAVAWGTTYPPVVIDSTGQPLTDGDGNQIFSGFDL